MAKAPRTAKGTRSPDEASARARLDGFLARFDPAIAAQARRAHAKLRALLPGTTELVYDNYNALVIAFASTDRASDAICSIALYPRWINLFFLRGAVLPDPKGVLLGSGSTVRRVLLEADTLARPEILVLLRAAVKKGRIAPDPRQKRRLLIKAEVATQRARRPR